MPNETAQPFEKPSQRNSQDIELVERVLGTKEAEEMRTLLDNPSPDKTPTIEDFSGVEMAVLADEQAAVVGVEIQLSPEKRRQQFIDWAEEFDMTESDVDQNFRFDDDGTVTMIDGRYLSYGKISWLPPGIKKVETSLNLSTSELKDCANIPDIIEGDLFLGASSITDLSGLAGKIIGEDLVLHDIPATKIPTGINVGKIYIFKDKQEELARDAVAKGYQVVRTDPSDNSDIKRINNGSVDILEKII